MNPDDDPETHESIVVGEYRGGPDGCPRRTGRFSATTSWSPMTMPPCMADHTV